MRLPAPAYLHKSRNGNNPIYADRKARPMTLPQAHAQLDAPQSTLSRVQASYAALTAAHARLATVQPAYEDLLRECPAVATDRHHPGYRRYSGALRESSTARINFNNAVAALRRATGTDVSSEELIRAWSSRTPAPL